MMKRIYESVVEEHLKKYRQMLFLVGPRQVGKTTTSLNVFSENQRHQYFNWDVQTDRLVIIEGADAVAAALELERLVEEKPLAVFDEVHKYRKWKNFIKGFFDKYGTKVRIIVTGSVKLDVYKKGGDSLMGRYFLYRLHPLSVGEIIDHELREVEIASQPKLISEEDFDALFNFGGFPEPFLQRDTRFYNLWKRKRMQQLFQEDMRDLTKIHEVSQLEILAELLQHQSGQLTSYTSLAKKVNVSIDTIRRWVEVLKAFYYCFSIQPWTKNVTRSLLKEPKIYLWDWSLVKELGPRRENFIASHLLKAVHFWTDRGLGDYGLYFLRDKEKREVDFLVSKNGKPWLLVEVKSSSNGGISKSLYHYQEMVKADFAIQVAFDMEYVNKSCFISQQPIIVPAKTFLSQLI